MDQDRMDVLFAKYLAGELSPEENEEWEWAVLANPSLRVTLQVLQRMREMPFGGTAAEEQEMLERGLQRIMNDTAPVYQDPADRLYQEGKVRRLSIRWWMAAAAVLILGVAGVMLYRGKKQPVI